MDAFTDIATFVLAAAEHGAAEEEGGSFLVSPNVGLMLWTLIAFGVSMLILKKFAFPAIGEALDKRAATIDESLNAAVRTKEEAEELLEEYRARLKEAREQAEDIVARSRKAADTTLEEAKSAAKEYGEKKNTCRSRLSPSASANCPSSSWTRSRTPFSLATSNSARL